MLFLFVALLCGGTAFVTAAPPGGAVGAAKQGAHDGENSDLAVADVEISNNNKCDVASLSGLIQGNQQAAIPFCAHLGLYETLRAKIATVTVTSTNTSTSIRTEYTTTTVAGGMKNGKVKARAAEVAPAPEVLVGRDGAVVEALIHQLEKCPQSAVGAACKGCHDQRILTTTTTKVKKVTATSTKTVTVTHTAPAFRIYSEIILDKRKRSTDDLPSKWYWEQHPDLPQGIRLSADGDAAAVFNLDYSTPGYLGSLTQLSTSNREGYTAVLLYAVNDLRPATTLWFLTMELAIAYGYATVRWKVDYMAKTISIVDPLDFYLFYCYNYTEEFWVYYNDDPVLEDEDLTDCVRADRDLKIEVI
ncbi:hypothetical protein V8F33_000254 [Rhypophila sp. PSN 637]